MPCCISVIGLQDEYSTPTETRQSPYRGRKFPVKLRFPANYPFKCPDVAFAADMMWHPQVEFKTGSVCAQDLEKMWGPTKMAADVAKFIREFLAHPSLDAAVEVSTSRGWLRGSWLAGGPLRPHSLPTPLTSNDTYVRFW